MSTLSVNPLKGMLDYPPAQQREFNYMKKVIDQTAEQLGYDEYELPILESMDTFAVKSSDEILRDQSYYFTDRGEREVILRPEITPSLARLVSKEFFNLPQPLRWYIIGRCYRYERPQKGRLREFYQLNFDLLGESNLYYDIEIFRVIIALMKNFQVREDRYAVQYNHRGMVDWLLEQKEFTSEEKKSFFHWIDRKNKLSPEDFKKEVGTAFNQQESKVSFIHDYINETNPRNFFKDKGDLPEFITRFLKLTESLESLASNIVFQPEIVRGFDYYTGVVFEVFSKQGEIRRSLFGGGRYDKLTANYLKEPVSGVGFGMGLYIFSLFLKELGVFPELKVVRKSYYLAPIKFGSEADVEDSKLLQFTNTVLQHLNGQNIQGVVHPPAPFKKHLQRAERLGFQKVVIFGEDEVKDHCYQVKDLTTSEQTKIVMG